MIHASQITFWYYISAVLFNKAHRSGVVHTVKKWVMSGTACDVIALYYVILMRNYHQQNIIKRLFNDRKCLESADIECIKCVNTTINHILSYRNKDTKTTYTDTLSSYTKAATPAMADTMVATAAEWPIVMALLLSADSAAAITALAPKPPSPAGSDRPAMDPIAVGMDISRATEPIATEPVAAGIDISRATEPVAAGMDISRATEPIAAGIDISRVTEPVAAGMDISRATEPIATEPVAAGMDISRATEPIATEPVAAGMDISRATEPVATEPVAADMDISWRPLCSRSSRTPG
jgi:hypothetical protein